jgi:polysaccharide chain length determinant protein (PEP-CTERM system associated)
MKELIEQALSYLRGMWHRRWIGLAAAWVAAVIIIAIVYRIPERYEAQARVYVDTESLLKPLMAGLAITPNTDQQVALMSRTLISRPNVERLIRKADLDLKVKTAAQREELTDDVIKTIKLSNVSANLYTIAYRDPSPEQAKRVVQELLNIFVESSLGDKRQDTQTAVKFLDEQIKRYEESLRAAEDRLKEFKLKYMGVADRDSDYFKRMSQLRTDIDSARMELASYEQARDAYKKELAGETPTLITEGPEQPRNETAVPEIDTRLAQLKKDLDDLLRKYTDAHPDVAGTKRLIEQLEKQKASEIEARKKAVAPSNRVSTSDRNPVFQQLRISLAEAEASVASARSKLAGYEAQYRALRAQAQLVPQVEAEFTQLNRDYDVQKKTYDNLIARREQATMGKDAQDTGGTQIRTIDPPRVSPDPVAPNRIALLAIACLLSVIVGLLASFAASQLMPTFHDARTLRDISKRPILGMVSMIPGEASLRRRRRERFLFAGGLSGLLAAFVAVMTVAVLVGRAA